MAMVRSLSFVYIIVQTLPIIITFIPELGSSSKDQGLKENWSTHNLSLFKVYARDSVKFYSDFKIELDSNSKRIFIFTSNIWSYMKRTYWSFGQNPNLFVVIHQESNLEGYISYAQNSEGKPKSRNLLDLGTLYPQSWEDNTTRNGLMDLIANKLFSFVEFSSKNCFRPPSFDVWNVSSYFETAWIDIFTYDVYANLNMAEQAERYLEEKLSTKVENYPREGIDTFWFRDWFLPIYEEYGRTKVLQEYFMLLCGNFPYSSETSSYTLDMGGFIHFWSGAAKTDLSSNASLVFGWNTTYQEQFSKAQKRFTRVTDLYNVKNQMFDDQSNSNEETDEENSGQELGHYGHVEQSHVIIGASVGLSIIFVITLVFVASILLFKKRFQALQMEIRALTNEEVNNFLMGDPNIAEDEAQAFILAMPFINAYEISREQIILAHEKVIGTGQYGSVVSAHMRLSDDNQLLPVAMKMAKPNVDVVYFKAFLSEVKIMAYLGKHENIVDLLGTCTTNIKNREIFIALELCSLGNLLDYLKKNRTNFQSTQESFMCSASDIQLLERHSVYNPCETDSNLMSIQDLFKWSLNISNAMVYLTEKKVIHGDLAARNILLTSNRVAKISDFGLSRQILNYENYMKTSKIPVPWRWLAIECLKENRFSTASDIWAFGVLLWEIFSLGELPYGGYTYDLFFVDKLINGERLLRPTHANSRIFNLMQDCWKIDPNDRLSFYEIHANFGELILPTLNSTTF